MADNLKWLPPHQASGLDYNRTKHRNKLSPLFLSHRAPPSQQSSVSCPRAPPSPPDHHPGSFSSVPAWMGHSSHQTRPRAWLVALPPPTRLSPSCQGPSCAPGTSRPGVRLQLPEVALAPSSVLRESPPQGPGVMGAAPRGWAQGGVPG